MDESYEVKKKSGLVDFSRTFARSRATLGLSHLAQCSGDSFAESVTHHLCTQPLEMSREEGAVVRSPFTRC